MGRKSKTEERQAEIINHLIHMLNEEGLEGTSLAKISNHMGVNKSLIAHYFQSKEEMMVALVDNITQRYKNTYNKLFEGVDDPVQRLNIFLNTVINLDWEIGKEISDRVFYSCFYLSFSNERIHRRIKKLYEFIKEVYFQEIVLYQKAGIINVENPEDAAVFILTMAEGCYYYSAIRGNESGDMDKMKNLALKVLSPDVPIV
jgi:AcrR family transcriptional regulator